ncbi:hypothetical protein GCM10010244_84880 [Streptomyces coeruleorubidus]|nr:hypothetical protein GCM10010244_84880 [Streptomyces bellus]
MAGFRCSGQAGLPPQYAARLFDAQEAGASEQQLRDIAAEGLGEAYFRDGGRRLLASTSWLGSYSPARPGNGRGTGRSAFVQVRMAALVEVGARRPDSGGPAVLPRAFAPGTRWRARHWL